MKLYKQKKQELERINDEMLKFGATKEEVKRLQEALSQAESQQQELKSQLEALQQELEREKAKKKLPPMSDDEFLKLCKSGDARKVEEAIMNGANVNAKNDDDMTVLMWAANNGHTETAEMLINHGADINETNRGWTALMFAVRGGRTETANLLRKYGAK